MLNTEKKGLSHDHWTKWMF